MSRLLLLSAALIAMTACGSLESLDPAPDDGDGGQGTPSPVPGQPPQPGDGGTDEEDGGMSEEDCDKVPEGDPLPAGQLITAKISCGDTIVGHTKGGANHFNTKFYEHNFCTPATKNHDSGDERIYELILPKGETNADIILDTPCANLSLAAMKVASGVPGPGSNLRVCEMNPNAGSREKVHIVSQSVNRWIVVVEGQDDAEGAFQLRVECHKGLY